MQPPNPLVVEAGGTLHRADTLAELAGKIGLPPQRLDDVVGEYNAAIDARLAASALAAAPQRPNKAWPIRTPPFYAMPICAAITNTMGGIVVDGDGRVLDKNDKPIPASTPPGPPSAGSTADRTPAMSAA